MAAETGAGGPGAGGPTGAAPSGAPAPGAADEADADVAGDDPRRRAGARRLLERRRRDLQGTLDAMDEGGLGETLGESLSELSTYDNHPADIGTETWKREQQMSMRSTLRHRVEEVDRALARLDAGTYGQCAACGARIPAERLAARPEALLCLACQDAEDEVQGDAAGGLAPAAEDEAARESGGAGGGGADGGEDKWATFWGPLARYGSSDSPSDAPETHRAGPGHIVHLDDDDDDPDAAGMHIVTDDA